eukprot:247622_1
MNVNCKSSRTNIVDICCNPTVSCSHHLFTTQSSLIDNMFGSIDRNLDDKFLHTANFCSHCVNSALAKLSFMDYIHFVANRFDGHYGSVYAVFTRNLLIHRKIHKIMIKSCKMTQIIYLNGEYKMKKNNNINVVFVHSFHTICEFIMRSVRCGWDDVTKVRKSDSGLSWIFHNMRMFHLSIKYWNKYHTLFFVNHYWLQLQKITKKIIRIESDNCKAINDERRALNENEDLILDTLIPLMEFILFDSYYKLESIRLIPTEIRNAYRKLKDFVIRVYEPNYNILVRMDSIRNIKHQVSCDWYLCNKKQQLLSFKICSGCKMTYFCSRKCQKKSWKTNHKQQCNALKLKYAL